MSFCFFKLKLPEEEDSEGGGVGLGAGHLGDQCQYCCFFIAVVLLALSLFNCEEALPNCARTRIFPGAGIGSDHLLMMKYIDERSKHRKG